MLALLVAGAWGGLGCAKDPHPTLPAIALAVSTGQILIDSVPFADIAATAPNGEARFGRVMDATRTSQGLIAVADVADAALVLVDSAGDVVRRSGRRGSGPGEHRYLAWVEQCAADSLFTWDPFLGRVDVLDEEGDVVRGFRLPGQAARVSCARNGLFAVVMRARDVRLPSATSPRYRASVVFANANGDSIATLRDVDVGQNRPLGAITRFAMSDEWLYVGTADSALVRAYGMDGSVHGVIVAGDARRPATRAHYDRAVDQLVAAMTDSSERAAIRERLLAIPMPEHLPAYTTLVADPSGNVWTVTSVPGDGATTIQVNSDEGTLLGTVRLPVELELFEAGADYLLGAYTGPDDEQHIAAYRIGRRAPPSGGGPTDRSGSHD